jgi:hypothetical protein
VDDHGDGAYRTAEFATALHDTLTDLAPSEGAELDGELARTLAGVADGRAKSKGIAAGHREAARSLAERSSDALETTFYAQVLRSATGRRRCSSASSSATGPSARSRHELNRPWGRAHPLVDAHAGDRRRSGVGGRALPRLR